MSWVHADNPERRICAEVISLQMSGLFSSVSGMISSFSSTLTSSLSNSMNTQDDFVFLSTFYQAYRECKSAHEVSLLVSNHAKYLKWLLNNTHLTSSQSCDILERCLICKALGHDVSFAAIHAIQLAQSSQCWHHKRTAYLACCELMDEHSDMAILMVSTLQQDLRSRHIPTICIALSTAAVIISSELMLSIDAIVCEKLNHLVPLVRQRAVVCLGAFVKKNVELVQSKLPYLKNMLLDKDPSVMAASLNILDSLPSKYIFSSDALFKPLCFILQQFLDGHTPKKFMKKDVCGPHVMVKLIRVLGKLDHSKVEWKQKLILSMLSVMDKYDSVLSAPAVMTAKESCMVLCRISTDSKHFARVANYSRKLLESKIMNYHFVSLQIFTELISHDKGQITQHQDLIVSALASREAVVAEKSILLIIQLTNAENVQSVYELYSKICSSYNGADRSMEYGVTILTSCELSEISIEWFAQKLMELLSGEQKGWNVKSVGHELSLNTLLTYIAKDSAKNSAVALYNCLDGLVTQEESSSLGIFTVMLWLRSMHRSVFSDSSFISLLRSGCRRAKRPCVYVTTFLTAVRSLLADSKTSIQDSDIESLKGLAVASGDEAACYIYLRDIEEIARDSVGFKYADEAVGLDSLYPDLEKYKNEQLSSQKCRQDGADVAKPEVRSLKFSPETDTRITTSLERSAQLGSAKEVWTAKGRVESVESRVTETQESIDDAAPVEFQVEDDGDDSTEKLTNHIFSSI